MENFILVVFGWEVFFYKKKKRSVKKLKYSKTDLSGMRRKGKARKGREMVVMDEVFYIRKRPYSGVGVYCVNRALLSEH